MIRLININMVIKDNPNFKPIMIPLSFVFLLAIRDIIRKLIAVNIIEILLIVILFNPVKLIREEIIAIIIINIKNKPKYFKYSSILFIKNHLLNYIT